jgi:GT2 family glycosyltransferase
MYFLQALIASYKAMPHLLPLQAESSSMINLARTRNGHAFLESDAEWIFLVDTDMLWEPGALIRLLQTAKEKKAKAVSGLAFMDHKGRIVPHAYQVIPNENGGYTQNAYATLPSHTEPFQVHAVGGACFLVHRHVYEDVALLSKGKTAYLWQEDVYQPGLDAQMGEDLSFCQRIRKAGHEIWYEPRSVFLHAQKPGFIGPIQYTEYMESLSTQLGNAA